VTPAEGAYDRTDYPSYNYINMTSGRPPKILESPMDSKSLLSGILVKTIFFITKIQGFVYIIVESPRDQGNIVGREYIHSCKFLYPYVTSLGDSTIGKAIFRPWKIFLK
jgi:hypothetical protein